MKYILVTLSSDDKLIAGELEWAPNNAYQATDSYIVRVYSRNNRYSDWKNFTIRIFGKLERAEDYLIEVTESSLWTILKGPN